MKLSGHDKALTFYDEIERMMRGGSTCMDSIMEYCYKRGLEVETIVPLVNGNSKLLSIFREELERVNVLKPVSHLPI